MKFLCEVVLFLILYTTKVSEGLHFVNEINLSENCTLLWNIGKENDVTFEVQARTFGYIGIGLSKDGRLSNADIVIVWMQEGNGFIEDLHIGSSGTMLKNDTKQDYHLTMGYENSTHTVIRFKRKMNTCDRHEDFPITESTNHVLLFLGESDPDMNSTSPFVGFFQTYKESKVLNLLHHPSNHIESNDIFLSTKELLNEKVNLPEGDNSLIWCKMFRLLDFVDKNHMIKFEPIFESEQTQHYLQQITLYECHDNTPKHDRLARLRGKKCHRPDFLNLQCNSIAAYWSKGSKGFTFPKNTGYPLNSKDIQFYLMETHYHNSQYQIDEMNVPTTTVSDMYQNKNETENEKTDKPQMVDSSGLKIYFTLDLRQHDVGALSIGIDPNWRHMIPPGQPNVLSEGHCIDKCTAYAFPQEGINIFAILTKTQTIGKQVRLRQIRDNNETQPIIFDSNIVSNYQEFRYLPAPVKALPGDQLIAECVYDSSSRKYITLGGHTTKDETCLIFSYYYPKQDRLSSCVSQPSLSTVLHALGIEKLTYGPNPLVIASPPELANMTIEERLATFDWDNSFDDFQEAMQQGDFKPFCWDSKFKAIQGTERLQLAQPIINNLWQTIDDENCKDMVQNTTENNEILAKGVAILSDTENEINNVIEEMTKSKVSRTHAVPTEAKTSINTVMVAKAKASQSKSSLFLYFVGLVFVILHI